MKTKTVIATFLILVGTTCLGALGLSYSGVVDVSATGREPALLRWFLETTQERSIARRVADMEVPELGTPAQLREGLEHYQAMCVGCHGAPGIDRDEVGAGLNPRPPRLDTAHDDDPARTFWVIRNGIRMTGMPAFGRTHYDETLWSIVALLQDLPDLKPYEYQARLDALGARPGDAHASHGADGHGADGHEAAAPSPLPGELEPADAQAESPPHEHHHGDPDPHH